MLSGLDSNVVVAYFAWTVTMTGLVFISDVYCMWTCVLAIPEV
jgi:hypothetical protein